MFFDRYHSTTTVLKSLIEGRLLAFTQRVPVHRGVQVVSTRRIK